MTAHGAADLVREALDPALVAAGFQSGQGGNALDGSGQVIFCIAHAELSRRYPRLPQAGQQDPAGTCDDLVIELSADGTVDRLDLEGRSLDATLRDVGLHADADAVTTTGRPLSEWLPAVEAAIRRLFEVAETGSLT